MRISARFYPRTLQLAGSALILAWLSIPPVCGQDWSVPASLGEYFRDQTQRLADRTPLTAETIEQWKQHRPRHHRQLREMLGLFPWPERTPLNAEVTGEVVRDGVRVERVVFQSRPGLYVTGNLYLPEQLTEPLPAVLYLCGHGAVKMDGVSYGNKVHYQHHGIWFARNGFACLTIDSLQLGEIEGIHHGTHRYGRWWWLGRGYTPAGVEAWNCIRALDYLQSRPEIDGSRIGATGRSGGGAYSWWIAALDERITAAVPVAGITDLQNHVVDGCVEGHCDCMFLVNTYQWDYPMVAAMVAPRPLLISNTDRDQIFPLDGVVRTFEKVKAVYSLYDAGDHVSMNISPGPHQDTQALRVHAFDWMNEHLRGQSEPITDVSEPLFTPQELKVLASVPEDERNTTADEWFVPLADPIDVPRDTTQWQEQKERWTRQLRRLAFAGWPRRDSELALRLISETNSGCMRYRLFRFTSQPGIELDLYCVQPRDLDSPDQVELRVLDRAQYVEFRDEWDARQRAAEVEPVSDPAPANVSPAAVEDARTMRVFFAPRCVADETWSDDDSKQVQILRRFYLLGQTLHGMQAYDVRRALQTLNQSDALRSPVVRIEARGAMAGVVLYASLFEEAVDRLSFVQLPASHQNGPFLLNAQRIFDMPQAVAMAVERGEVRLLDTDPDHWQYVVDTIRRLHWPLDQLRFASAGDQSLRAATQRIVVGTIDTVVGTGESRLSAVGEPRRTNVGNPFGVEIGPDQALYITEVSNHRVFRLDRASGQLQVIAGTGQKGYDGDGGPATSARMNEPYEVRFDADGNLYVVEMQNHVVRRIDRQTGQIETIAGTGKPGYSGDGGPATLAQLKQPHSIAIGRNGELYIADIGNHRIRRVDLRTGVIESIAGNGDTQLPVDGEVATDRPVFGPRALYYRDGMLWVALREGNSIWTLDCASYRWKHLAGTGEAGYAGDGGPARQAQFRGPKGIAVGPSGRVVIVDTENQVIRQIDPATSLISTMAGAGPDQRGYGGDADAAVAAKLNRPHGISVAPDGIVFIGDSENHRVRAVRPSEN